jgi:hypothetical protein
VLVDLTAGVAVVSTAEALAKMRDVGIVVVQSA